MKFCFQSLILRHLTPFDWKFLWIGILRAKGLWKNVAILQRFVQSFFSPTACGVWGSKIVPFYFYKRTQNHFWNTYFHFKRYFFDFFAHFEVVHGVGVGHIFFWNFRTTPKFLRMHMCGRVQTCAQMLFTKIDFTDLNTVIGNLLKKELQETFFKLFKLIEVGWTVINLHSVLLVAAASLLCDQIIMVSESSEWRGTLKTCSSIVDHTKVTPPPGPK